MSKITNGKWKFIVKVPGEEPLDSELIAKLYNQPLFFSALQARHKDMIPNPNPDATVWSFVKNQMETEFLLAGTIQPMFTQYKSSDENTMLSIQGMFDFVNDDSLFFKCCFSF